MNQRDIEILESAGKGIGTATRSVTNILIALIHALVARGVLSEDDVRRMFDGIEEVLRETELHSPRDEDERDLTMALTNRLRTILLSDQAPA